jgi:hypothetical protein
MRMRTQAQILADKKRPGRPPAKPEVKKRHVLSVYLTDSEFLYLKSKAKANKLSLAATVMIPWRRASSWPA